ncbi:unnamed protein product [Gadus morhua 'NCC']
MERADRPPLAPLEVDVDLGFALFFLFLLCFFLLTTKAEKKRPRVKDEASRGQWQTERSSCSISRACWAGTTEMRIQKLRRSCSTSSLSWDRTPWGRGVDPGMGLMLREIQNGTKSPN